jgi:hypothetical protein
MKKDLIILVTLFICCSLFQGCKYSFKGTSIDPDVETFYVEVFDIKVLNAPPTIGQDFSNELTEKIQRESRLNLSDTDPDISFEGVLTRFEVTEPSPEAGERVAFNRLNVNVKVDFLDKDEEDAIWSQQFSYFSDFSTSQNLLDVQEELLEDIYDQLVEDVFNKAFTNW